MKYTIRLLTLNFNLFQSLFILALSFSLSACSESQEVNDKNNKSENIISCQAQKTLTAKRNFKMGFSTWPFSPDEPDKEKLYQFINHNADIYSEQIDDKIPWTELLEEKSYPEAFLADIKNRKARRLTKDLLLSVSILNDERDNLAKDISGNDYDLKSSLTDARFEDAYYQYVKFLIEQFHPQYLVVGMEVNELYINNDQQTWDIYQQFMKKFRSRIKQAFPAIQISESITLHNLTTAEVDNKEAYLANIKSYAQQFDFFAVSFHPLFMGVKTKKQSNEAFNYLTSFTNKKIAFVETSQIAEDLSVLSLFLNVKGDACSQAEYLQTLFEFSQTHNIDFLIWFSYKDYDKLWESFPFYIQGFAKIWRDTGLIDQDDVHREAFKIWLNWYNNK